jgi:hypothetical protein
MVDRKLLLLQEIPYIAPMKGRCEASGLWASTMGVKEEALSLLGKGCQTDGLVAVT